MLLGCALTTVYFAYHAVEGRHGLEARTRLIERSANVEREIGRLETVRSTLNTEVGLLASDVPDPDFVDEIARGTLGFAHPEDTILLGR